MNGSTYHITYTDRRNGARLTARVFAYTRNDAIRHAVWNLHAVRDSVSAVALPPRRP